MSLYSENQASPHIIFFHAYDMAKHIMKGYLMYNDNYHPSMAEDDITSAAAPELTLATFMNASD